MATPLTPVNLIPWGGQVIVTSQDNSFTWQSDGTQAAYYLEYAQNITGATALNVGWVTDSLNRHIFLADTFTNTYEYKWRVKTRNIQGQESLFSDWAVFRAGNAALLTIVFPVKDFDQLTTMPVYQHVYNDPNGYLQHSYRYRVYTGTIWDEFDAMTAEQQESMTWDELEQYSKGGVVWDSGIVESPATSVEQPAGYFQIYQYWYKVQATIWNTGNNEVISDIRTFGLLIESIPKEPIISTNADTENGQIIIKIINPLADPGQIGVAYNRLYRKRLDGSWELIHDNITDGFGYDRTFASRKQEEYSVTAVGTNGIESGRSVSALGYCALNAYWFTNPTTNQTVKLKAMPKWSAMSSEREREEFYGIDEKYPSITYGASRFYRGSFKAMILRPTDGTTWPQYIEQIRQVLDADDKTPIIFRSPWGDVFKVDIAKFQIEPADRTDQYRNVEIEMVEVEEIKPAGVYSYEVPPNPIDGYWLVSPDTGKGFKLFANPQMNTIYSERDRTESTFLKGEMPRISYSSRKSLRGGFSGYLLKSGSATSLAELVMALRELVDGKEKKPLIFKTLSGDEFLVDTYGFSFELVDRIDQARRVSFEFIEVGSG